MNCRGRCAPAAALALLVLAVGPVQGQAPDRAGAMAGIEEFVRANIASGRIAGVSIGVVVGRDTLLLRGYGSADLELDVPTPDAAVYEIGSITKQFTAVAILQLRDRGLLSLDDELSQYVPQFDTRGHRITIRRLLDHTSGIRGYTEMLSFRTIAAQGLPRDTLLRLVEAEPFDFAPGEAMIYNNSAYFLLGLVIEKVTGTPYERYVREHLFEPAGMADSHYCSNTAVVKRRARGYAVVPDGFRRSDFIHHNWPYAAGSLCSTVGDLIAWNAALHGGRLLGEASYRELITPGTLSDGTPLRYAMGLSRTLLAGHDAIAHGGGIPGYLSDAAYLPAQDATIVVLMNSAGGVAPPAITNRIVTALFGSTPPAPPVPYTGSLDALAGTFTGRGRGADLTLHITVGDGRLLARPSTAPVANATALDHIGDGVFRGGNTLYRFDVAGGRAVRVRADQGSGVYVLTRTD